MATLTTKSLEVLVALRSVTNFVLAHRAAFSDVSVQMESCDQIFLPSYVRRSNDCLLGENSVGRLHSVVPRDVSQDSRAPVGS